MPNCRRIWLILPFWLLFSADIALTLLGQPHDYWSGNHALAVEYNPLAYLILIHGPLLFAGLAVGWAIAVGLLILCCHHPLAVYFAAGAAFIHALGGCSWIVRFGDFGWILAAGYLFVSSELSYFFWRRSIEFD